MTSKYHSCGVLKYVSLIWNPAISLTEKSGRLTTGKIPLRTSWVSSLAITTESRISESFVHRHGILRQFELWTWGPWRGRRRKVEKRGRICLLVNWWKFRVMFSAYCFRTGRLQLSDWSDHGNCGRSTPEVPRDGFNALPTRPQTSSVQPPSLRTWPPPISPLRCVKSGQFNMISQKVAQQSLRRCTYSCFLLVAWVSNSRWTWIVAIPSGMTLSMTKFATPVAIATGRYMQMRYLPISFVFNPFHCIVSVGSVVVVGYKKQKKTSSESEKRQFD